LYSSHCIKERGREEKGGKKIKLKGKTGRLPRFPANISQGKKKEGEGEWVVLSTPLC